MFCTKENCARAGRNRIEQKLLHTNTHKANKHFPILLPNFQKLDDEPRTQELDELDGLVDEKPRKQNKSRNAEKDCRNPPADICTDEEKAI